LDKQEQMKYFDSAVAVGLAVGVGDRIPGDGAEAVQLQEKNQ
jgi:hypothetical protein